MRETCKFCGAKITESDPWGGSYECGTEFTTGSEIDFRDSGCLKLQVDQVNLIFPEIMPYDKSPITDAVCTLLGMTEKVEGIWERGWASVFIGSAGRPSTLAINGHTYTDITAGQLACLIAARS